MFCGENMSIKKSIFVLLLLTVFSWALIISGDAGEEWAKNKSQEMCARSDVAAVYICLGNTVDVVWKDKSKGSTFYRPDGRVVDCPPDQPTNMGAECMQLMMPNYCTLDKNVCGERPPEEFPGGIKTEEQPKQPSQPTPQQPPQQPSEQPQIQPSQQQNISSEVSLIPPSLPPQKEGATTTISGTLDNLIIAIFVLGVITLLVLYFAFKRTTRY